MKQNKIIVGITGSIGTGKSTLSNFLKSKGYIIVDADNISNKIYTYGSEAYKRVLNEFGDSILDDLRNIDRAKLKELVFSHPDYLSVLNTIVHPIIIKLIHNEVLLYLESNNIVFVDAALLIESGLIKIVDKVILITCLEDIQIKRIISRDNISVEMAVNIIKSQIPSSEKIKYADFVIENNSDINKMYLEIEKILNILEKGLKNVETN